MTVRQSPCTTFQDEPFVIVRRETPPVLFDRRYRVLSGTQVDLVAEHGLHTGRTRVVVHHRQGIWEGGFGARIWAV